MKQLMFDIKAHRLCHRTDPQTSHDAAAKIVESGKLNKQEGAVLEAIWWHKAYRSNTFTAKELNHYSELDYYIIQRRLSGLQKKGKIERTGEKRDGCCVWRLK